MIVVNLIGGLGNQIFQYACGRALSLRTGQDLMLATDQFIGYGLHNGFELERVFNIDVKYADDNTLRSLLGWQSIPKIRHLLGRPSMRWACTGRWCSEPHFNYWPEINHFKESCYVHGYWQSENYFFDFHDVIRKDLSFKIPWDNADMAIYQAMRECPSVSLHVRRGDYQSGKNKRIFASLGESYYINAIAALRKYCPELNVFAFSDDPNWVNDVLAPKIGTVHIVTHNVGARSANDLRLMASADHHIIANSSFSWWGAWLNNSPKKIVISPKQWFLDGRDISTLLPASWLKI